jgi:RNA-binding protein
MPPPTRPSLNEAQRKHLRRLGHERKPVVLIGQSGLAPGVVAELERALDDHELVKVKARVGDRDLRTEIFTSLAAQTRAELVQRIGNVGLFFRRNEREPVILLPD